MAKIRWDGKVFNAEPVRQLANGNWIMRAQSHGARFAIGTEIEVTTGEIVEMTTIEDAARAQMFLAQQPPDHSLARVEAAMAAERATLPSLQQVIATSPPIAHDAPDKVVSVPTDPTQRP